MPILVHRSVKDGSVRKFVSSDDLERLKQLARRAKRARGIPHHEALDVVARRIKFGFWHQVTLAHKAMLPTETAVREGVVIAMDAKDADGLYDGIPLQDGNGRFVADPLLSSFYESELYRLELEGIDEEDGRPNHEKWTEQQLREFAQARLEELVFYRFEGEPVPKDPAAVVDLVAATVLFGAEIVRISGQAYDTYSVSDSAGNYVRF